MDLWLVVTIVSVFVLAFSISEEISAAERQFYKGYPEPFGRRSSPSNRVLPAEGNPLGLHHFNEPRRASSHHDYLRNHRDTRKRRKRKRLKKGSFRKDQVGGEKASGHNSNQSWGAKSDRENVEKILNQFWDQGFGVVKMWFYDRGEAISKEHGNSENLAEKSWKNQTEQSKTHWGDGNQKFEHENRNASGENTSKWKNHGYFEKASNEAPTDDPIETISKYLDNAGLAFEPSLNSSDYSPKVLT